MDEHNLPRQAPIGADEFSAAESAPLPSELQARLVIARERAAAKVAAAPAPSVRTDSLLAAADKARTRAQRVVWLHRWASAEVEPLAAVAACRRGCAHCCHIPVTISATEARLIGRASGRKPRSPTDGIACDPAITDQASDWTQQQQIYLGQPCPFLSADSSCSVYEHRPLACRTHLSLDDDDLLCRLVPGVSVPVPYVDARLILAIGFGSQPGETLADIRAFFDVNHPRD